MSFGGTLKEQDFVAAQRLHLRPRPFFAVVGVVLLAATAWAIAVAKSIWLVIAVLYLFAWYFWYQPYMARKAFRQYKALSEPTVVSEQPEGLYFKRSNGEGLVPWGEVFRWRHNRTLVLLYPSSNVFHIVPSHFFESDSSFKEFVEIVRTRLGAPS